MVHSAVNVTIDVSPSQTSIMKAQPFQVPPNFPSSFLNLRSFPPSSPRIKWIPQIHLEDLGSVISSCEDQPTEF